MVTFTYAAAIESFSLETRRVKTFLVFAMTSTRSICTSNFGIERIRSKISSSVSFFLERIRRTVRSFYPLCDQIREHRWQVAWTDNCWKWTNKRASMRTYQPAIGGGSIFHARRGGQDLGSTLRPVFDASTILFSQRGENSGNSKLTRRRESI